MTPDEKTLLTRFLQDLTQARGGLKDAEASDLIDRSLRANPDAAYLLVQHAIIADQALHAAQDRIGQLESQARNAQPQGQGGGSFLGGGGPWQGGPPQGGQQQGYGQQAMLSRPTLSSRSLRPTRRRSNAEACSAACSAAASQLSRAGLEASSARQARRLQA